REKQKVKRIYFILEIIAELSFEDEINAFNLLLFAQLLAITNQRLATTQRIAMLSGRLCTALFNRTRWLVASITLEKKFCTFAATQTAHRISIPSQLFMPPVCKTEKFTGCAITLALHPLG